MDRSEVISFMLCMLASSPIYLSIARTVHTKMGYCPRGLAGVIMRILASIAIVIFVAGVSRMLLMVMRVAAE